MKENILFFAPNSIFLLFLQMIFKDVIEKVQCSLKITYLQKAFSERFGFGLLELCNFTLFVKNKATGMLLKGVLYTLL